MAGREIREDANVYALHKWQISVRCGYFTKRDGYGCWVDAYGQHMTEAVFDDVFGEPPEGCTYVVWVPRSIQKSGIDG